MSNTEAFIRLALFVILGVVVISSAAVLIAISMPEGEDPYE